MSERWAMTESPWRHNLVLQADPNRKPTRFDNDRLPAKSPADFRRAKARREIERRNIEKEAA